MQTFRFKADEEKLSAGANRTPTAFVYDTDRERERERGGREAPPTISVMIFLLRVVHRVVNRSSNRTLPSPISFSHSFSFSFSFSFPFLFLFFEETEFSRAWWGGGEACSSRSGGITRPPCFFYRPLLFPLELYTHIQ